MHDFRLIFRMSGSSKKNDKAIHLWGYSHLWKAPIIVVHPHDRQYIPINIKPRRCQLNKSIALGPYTSATPRGAFQAVLVFWVPVTKPRVPVTTWGWDG